MATTQTLPGQRTRRDKAVSVAWIGSILGILALGIALAVVSVTRFGLGPGAALRLGAFGVGGGYAGWLLVLFRSSLPGGLARP